MAVDGGGWRCSDARIGWREHTRCQVTSPPCILQESGPRKSPDQRRMHGPSIAKPQKCEREEEEGCMHPVHGPAKESHSGVSLSAATQYRASVRAKLMVKARSGRACRLCLAACWRPRLSSRTFYEAACSIYLMQPDFAKREP